MWTAMMIDHSDAFVDAKDRMLGQAEVTKDLWDDQVQQRFYDQFVNPSIQAVDYYLNGHDKYVGMGLRDLTAFVNNKIIEFNAL